MKTKKKKKRRFANTYEQSRKSPKTPAQMSPKELENYLTELGQVISTSQTVDDRRTLVGRLKAQGLKRSDLIRFICPAFGIKPGTLDDDLAWVKEWMLKGIKEKSQEERLAEVVETADEIVRQAFNKGDLQVANASNKHRAELFGLTREKDDVPIIPLGVIMLPAQEEAREWLKKAKAHKPKR